MLNYIIISAFFAYGMFTIQRPGFLLDFLRPVWKKLPKGLHEPLFECGVCTASIWGGLCFLFLSYVIGGTRSATPLIWLPVVIVAASGVQAVMDRAVKAFEKHYGYKPPTKDVSKQWDYLLPYEQIRSMMVNGFVNVAFLQKRHVIEIGGYHKDWAVDEVGVPNILYDYFDGETLFGEWFVASEYRQPYTVVILGLAYEGNLRHLRSVIAQSHSTIIEYSDDGISRQQVELLTEGLPVKLLIPEFEISVPDGTAPPKCGQAVTKRKLLIIQN